MKSPKCNRAFAEVLAASVDPDWRGRPRLHQKRVDSAFIVAIFLATVALILCAVR